MFLRGSFPEERELYTRALEERLPVQRRRKSGKRYKLVDVEGLSILARERMEGVGRGGARVQWEEKLVEACILQSCTLLVGSREIAWLVLE